jgi:molecular chaperone GrpE
MNIETFYNDNFGSIEDMTAEVVQKLMLKYAEEYSKDKSLRLLADMENMRKRSKTTEEELRVRYLLQGMEGMMNLVDDIQTAVNSSRPETVELLTPFLEKGLSILSNSGFHRIDSEYDPDIHEVVHMINNPEIDKPKIRSVISNGYKYKDKVVRHPKVIVEMP